MTSVVSAILSHIALIEIRTHNISGCSSYITVQQIWYTCNVCFVLYHCTTYVVHNLRFNNVPVPTSLTSESIQPIYANKIILRICNMEHLSSLPVFSEVRVTWSLVSCVRLRLIKSKKKCDASSTAFTYAVKQNFVFYYNHLTFLRNLKADPDGYLTSISLTKWMKRVWRCQRGNQNLHFFLDFISLNLWYAHIHLLMPLYNWK
jgi:hypothetical protein